MVAQRQSPVPLWLQRIGAFSWRIVVLVALAAVLIWIAFLLGTVTASVIVALIVAATFAPIGLRLRERGWSATASAAAVTGAAVLVAAGLILLLALTFVPYIPAVIDAVGNGVDAAKEQIAAAASPDMADEAAATAAGIQTWVTDSLAAVVGSVANAFTIALLALFLTFFFLQDGDKGWGRAIEVTDGWRRERINDAGHVALVRVGGYLRGTAILSAVVAVTDLLYLTILGVPLAAPLAVFVFLAGFIPYIGGLIATATLLLVAWATVGPQTVVILFLLITATRLVVSNVLRPMVYGRKVGLHPAVILLVLPAGAAVAGIVGVFAAVPVTVFVASVTASIIAVLEPPTRAESGTDVPPWLDRLAQWGWRLLAFLGVAIVAVGILGLVPLVVAPMLLAVILASSVVPVVVALRRRGWGSTRAAAVVTGGSFLAVLAVMVVAVASLGPGLVSAVQGATSGADEAGAATDGALGWLGSASEEVSGNILAAVTGVLSAVSALAVVFLLGGLLTFYLLRDGQRGWEGIAQRVDPWRRGELEATVRDSVAVLGGYMGGTAVISAVGALSQLLIMLVLGLPYAVPVAVLSFFACFIPYVGGFVTTGIAFLIAVAFGTGADILIMGIYTLVFNIVQGNIVTPLVYRRAVHLHPAVILLAIPAGGAVAGIAGMFLAVPILALFATIRGPALRLLGEAPAPLASGHPVGETSSGGG
jgi:predicted PurR-regulated permease PerM